MSLRKKITTGVIWVSVASSASQTVRFAVMLVLAWLLTPDDFGLVGLAGVVIAFSSLLTHMGLGQAFVQREEVDQVTADTVFIFNLVMALGLTIVVAGTAPWTAFLFNEPRLTPVLQVLALNIFISGVSVVPEHILDRELAFKEKVWPETASVLIYGLVAIMLAWLGWGVWSLVVGTLTSSLIRTVMLWRVSRYHLTWQFNRQEAWSLWQYGQHPTYLSLIQLTTNNSDKIYIGRFISVTQVGYYGLAFRISNLTSEYFTKRLIRVLFPAFTKLQNNQPRLREAYLTVLRYFSYAALPITFGLMSVAPVAIIVMYGEKWMPAIPLTKILVFYGLFRSLGQIPLFPSVGLPAIDVKVLIWRTLALGILIFPLGYFLETEGVALAVTLAMAGSTLWKIQLDRRYLQLSIFQISKQVVPAALASIVMAIGVSIISWTLTPSIITLGIMITSGIVLYLLILGGLAGRQFYRDITDISTLLLKKRSKPLLPIR